MGRSTSCRVGERISLDSSSHWGRARSLLGDPTRTGYGTSPRAIARDSGATGDLTEVRGSLPESEGTDRSSRRSAGLADSQHDRAACMPEASGRRTIIGVSGYFAPQSISRMDRSAPGLPRLVCGVRLLSHRSPNPGHTKVLHRTRIQPIASNRHLRTDAPSSSHSSHSLRSAFRTAECGI